MSRQVYIVIFLVASMFLIQCNALLSPNTDKHIQGVWKTVPLTERSEIWEFRDNTVHITRPHGEDSEHTYSINKTTNADYVHIKFETRYSDVSRWEVVRADKEGLYLISEHRGGDNSFQGGFHLEFSRQ